MPPKCYMVKDEGGKNLSINQNWFLPSLYEIYTTVKKPSVFPPITCNTGCPWKVKRGSDELSTHTKKWLRINFGEPSTWLGPRWTLFTNIRTSRLPVLHVLSFSPCRSPIQPPSNKERTQEGKSAGRSLNSDLNSFRYFPLPYNPETFLKMD